MARNLVLGFALALGGAVLMDAGIKQFKNAEGTSGGSGSSSGSGSSTSSTTPLTDLPSPTTAFGGGVTSASGLNSNQQTFANQLAADTGLDPSVVAAWVISEEPASSSEAPNGANNWLNIGSTDSGFFGANTTAWTNPVTAANATAQWLAGADNIAGYGAASSGIRAILATAGQAPAVQVSAIQNSGWASTGYPNLLNVYEGIASKVAADIKTVSTTAGEKKNPVGEYVTPHNPVVVGGVTLTGG
jgi:hypothetical protein